MPSIKSKSFDDPDGRRDFPGMQSQLAHIGALTVGRAVIEPGWNWSASIGSLTGSTVCHVHHVNLILSGRMRFVMEDGESGEFGPNTLVDVPPGHDAWVVGDESVVIIDLYGNAEDVGVPVEHQRVVTTILMTDIVDSTVTAGRLGDAKWRQLLAEHDRLVRARFERFGAQEVNTTGDGFIATVPSAIGALRCATAIRDDVAALGLAVRIGVHTGEVELVADDLHGVTVHATARIMALAGPSEVLTSELTRNLVDGSGLRFDERGSHSVKGFDRPITVFALA
ncbi:MAG TPA: adenylate/guanylate cyclase domain-containing protein [Candidatus Limnocylindrales bacterium]|nr:adenylate/guanylate cyclase domain-containing protein [Candidatus Limnocylindrales bacterium]